LHFRLFVQPMMAILFAVRDGSRDTGAGRGAYLWSLVFDPAQRRYLLESGWKGISKVFVLALVSLTGWRRTNGMGHQQPRTGTEMC
jgi:hypothetical protein